MDRAIVYSAVTFTKVELKNEIGEKLFVVNLPMTETNRSSCFSIYFFMWCLGLICGLFKVMPIRDCRGYTTELMAVG
jgi:hypothetical protein